MQNAKSHPAKDWRNYCSGAAEQTNIGNAFRLRWQIRRSTRTNARMSQLALRKVSWRQLLLLQWSALYWNDAVLQQDHLLPNLSLQTQRRIPHGNRLEEKAWQSYADGQCTNWLAPPRLRSWQLCSQRQLCMGMCWNLALAAITACPKFFFATSGL